MRSLFARSLLLLVIFASASRAQAATVDITLSSVGPNQLGLFVSTQVPLGSLALLISDGFISFTAVHPSVQIPAVIPEICDSAPSGFGCFIPQLSPPLPAFGGTVPLGVFNTTGPPYQVLPGDDLFGASAFNSLGEPIFDVSLAVPEPGVSGLALLGLLAVTLRARRHA